MNGFERLFAVSGLSLDRLRTFLRVSEAGNLAKAALGDVTKQSQFSRQIKELEAFFGVALTRRVGRRIEITEEGHRLALIIRRQFGELDNFRESMAGRSVNVRFGSQGSVIDWLLVPRLPEIREALGSALVELEQMRSAEVVRSVADGRLDFGIVRSDAVPGEVKRWNLGEVGYAVFAANRFWKGCSSPEELVRNAPVAELKSGGQFSDRWQEWLTAKHLAPQVFARVSSFSDLARIVQAGQAAAVLPDLAAVDFEPKRIKHQPIATLKNRPMVLIANARSLDRSGMAPSIGKKLAEVLHRV
ncbi:MAG: LysR family transcriptional regulator [Verrucomicrobiota bacterium JB025]|nr:LysR family transcriptional regulator [Verrucomicrobiota bacterium JB025]